MVSAEVGRRLRQIRHARGKTLTVVADLAGISPSYLCRLESGDRALDRRSLVLALAEALEVAPSEITGAPLPVPRARAEDRALGEVRLALLAAGVGEPGGEVRPVERLSARVAEVVAAENAADSDRAGAALPGLIRDLHTTLDAHRDERAVLRLLTVAHVQGAQAWLTTVGAPLDLAWQAATLARDAAERLDDPVCRGVAAFGTSLGLLGMGAFDLASRAAGSVAVPTDTPQGMRVAGMLALVSSLVAAARRDHAGRTSALEHAAELAERTGEGNALGLGFGPANVAVWRMQVALESGEHAEAARIASAVDPTALTVRAREAVYWREFGHALARLPGRHDDAVAVLRRAERISPHHVRRHPFTRSVLTELLGKVRRAPVSRELRGMAHRAGLLV
ncbi:Helix-turn-helix domain-containing protein [Streptoalloteichus tenebrarius]|uniref:Helix-turn-helix domain-containing protein n=1 Tax=Streptoalloteichus tenebrarius (strain ATCC 17920 / DSM 40477 / JCM 4838 / CBS 697.72 / NBRC 16177 / NCIMB 11028 / NRRL B-12390 / A12253. 1 / ISP 5477) TaxID=1933 RepID=A0ABT1HTA1_STRSD|nr:helix-turn-helix transcriptional regulator [Streptoalloteichus tenebrarius]MCP2258732.1 Helix-turn-helix domain-containing protein [Streptoalloteichus tenebrarius]BFF02884.1 helix-turn-helix transcriptional regulator [Streptoalloteichus tenebrarius]